MSSRRPRAILVDMDDTILAAGQRPQVLLAIARGLASDLLPHSPETVAVRLEAALAAFWGDPERQRIARFGIAEARRAVVRETFATLPPLSPDLADRFAADFSAARDAMTVCFPGALEGLQALKDLGVRLALVTNGSAATQRAKIERFGLAAYFDHIQIEGEMGFGKPEVGLTAVWCDGFNLGLPADAPCRRDHIVVSLSELPGLFA